MSLPIYSSTVIKQWDEFTILNEPISSLDLMERAATVSTSHLLNSFDFESANIFCGPGNNGGDGLVIARLLSLSNKIVHVYLLNFGNTTAEFKSNLDRLGKQVKVIELNANGSQIELESDIIIDCIFGSGLNKPVTGWIGNVINQINAIDCQKIAIDIPSGLFATYNTDKADYKHIVEANCTITFMAPKLAFLFSENEKYVGKLLTVDIGLSEKFDVSPIARFMTESDIKLKKRNTNDYKSTNGCLTVIGGLDTMTGAIIIAGSAALRSGSGYLIASCSEKGRTALTSTIPEAIWESPVDFVLNNKTTAIAIGPGLGKSDLAVELLEKILDYENPLVIDADAIRLLGERPKLIEKLPANSILTPHKGELISLIGEYQNSEDTLKVQQDFSIKHQVFIIQKGPYSKLTTPDGKVIINSTGNPGMATAGMGDALTGIIGSLLAQDYSPFEAASFGMFIHGFSADIVANRKGQTGLLASDVIEQLPLVMNQLSKS